MSYEFDQFAIVSTSK